MAAKTPNLDALIKMLLWPPRPGHMQRFQVLTEIGLLPELSGQHLLIQIATSAT